jgi:hypothetical protein
MFEKGDRVKIIGTSVEAKQKFIGRQGKVMGFEDIGIPRERIMLGKRDEVRQTISPKSKEVPY